MLTTGATPFCKPQVRTPTDSPHGYSAESSAGRRRHQTGQGARVPFLVEASWVSPLLLFYQSRGFTKKFRMSVQVIPRPRLYVVRKCCSRS